MDAFNAHSAHGGAPGTVPGAPRSFNRQIVVFKRSTPYVHPWRW